MIKKFVNRETILYLIFGVGTTIVNFLSFFVAIKCLGIQRNVLANIISFILATTFAFLTNKQWVFQSSDWSRKRVLKEFTSFCGARVFSFIIEAAGLFVCVNIAGVGERIGGEREVYLIKIILAFLVVILNYIFSKLFIFRHSK